jgi:succinoglycan biosynthesis protein ExoW
VTALEQGDFYFADHYQLGQTVSAFKRAGRIDPERHFPIAGNLRRYDGDMFDQILCGNIIGTSTVVYRFSKFPTLRFREEFVNAGEDYIFWLEMAKLTERIVFSAECECTYGEGVNIFAGSGWGTEQSLTRLHYEIKFKRALPRLFHLTAAQGNAARDAVAVLRRSFVADVLHRIAHRKPLGGKLLMMHARIDPKSFLFFLPIGVKIMLGR